MPRNLRLIIETATEVGFVVHDGDEVVGAFATPAELANFIEQKAAAVEGEGDRVRIAENERVDMPNVIERRSLWNRR